MAQMTDAQKLVFDELQALMKAWEDRGTAYRDVIPLFATWLVTLSIKAGYAPDLILTMVGRMWGQAMLSVVQDKIAQPIPDPFKPPPSKL